MSDNEEIEINKICELLNQASIKPNEETITKLKGKLNKRMQQKIFLIFFGILIYYALYF